MGNLIKITFCVLLLTIFSKADEAGNKFIFSPSHYDLKIITSSKNFKDNPTADDLRFDGEIKIEFDIKKNTIDDANEVDINLNANANTTVKKCTVEAYNGNAWETLNSSHSLKNNFLTIKLKNYDSTKTQYRLNISFTNLLRDDMTGFYRSSYVDSSSKTRWLLTTHFEPIYARLAFPCFDQPDLKAKFDIQITSPKGKIVLCNTPVSSKIESGDNQIVTFKQTLHMSTYLVAFTVSDFIATPPEKFQSNYPSPSERILLTHGREEIINKGDGKLAQITGKSAITELGKYLDLGYAFDKIDQVGIPDFSAGAMENWGHISFREKALFFNDKTGSVQTKQSNVLTITHELVHQWFGNLVTLESWDYIWLNEAFANYLEYVMAAKFNDPKSSEWELLKQFVVSEMHLRAFETDGFNSSKPLNNKITDESLILPSFNDIPYSKGASVLRMWETAIGSEKFRTVLQKYVQGRKLQSSNPKILYNFFKNEVKMEEKFFTTWTEQAGYPVVEVKKTKTGNYTLTQKRFLWENSTSRNIWYIPISYTTDNSDKKFDPTPTHWLYDKPINILAKGKWIIVNNQQTGYYRVNYDKENWIALSEVLKTNHSVINEYNRAQLINDVFSLAKSLQGNYVEYKTALDLAKYLEKEISFHPWKTALSSFDFLMNKLRGREVADKLEDYIYALIKPHFKSLKLENSNHVEKLKNIEISRWACSLGLDSCVKEAKKFFNDSSYENLADVQEIILCTAVKLIPSAWNEILTKYTKEKDSSIKLMYISSLGCTQDAIKAEEFLNKTLQQNGIIRPQDSIYVLSSVYNGNPKHIDIAFKFIEKNYKQIAQKYGGINPLGRALVGISRKINSGCNYKRLVTLIENIKKGEEGKAAKDSLENALGIGKSNVEWVDTKQDQLIMYFNSGSLLTYSLSLLLLPLVTLFNFYVF